MKERSDSCDIAVIGNGLVGAAAAKYLAGEGRDVVLVGPMQYDAMVYDCHNDEARICRRLDVDPVWSELAKRSMERYKEIENDSGIKFHYPCGCLAVGRRGGAYLEAVDACAKRQHVSLEALDQHELKARWPDLRLDATLLKDTESRTIDSIDSEEEIDTIEYAALYEQNGAGHISPRSLVRAQLKLFGLRGGRCVDAVVDALSKEDSLWKLRLSNGNALTAKSVLLATNAWTNFRALLPQKLAMTLTTQTAIRRRLLRNEEHPHIPAIIVRAGTKKFGACGASSLDACYFLPPVKYDDNKYWLKLGHGTFFERPLYTEAEAIDWYRGHEVDKTDAYARCDLVALLQRLCGNLLYQANDWTQPHTIAIKCVIPKTPTKRPYLSKFDHRLVACVGCNGYAAKSSDELGRLSAQLLLHSESSSICEPFDFGPHIPNDAFQPVYLD